jgi:predicted amidohydrolase YtcJ
MQPSHCTSDIEMVRKYWGARGRNAYIFRTILDAGVDLALGSDAPIEPLDPLAGIEAAVRRARPGKRDVFYPEERLTVAQALHGFTVGSATSVGLAHRRGYLLPGYDADFVILAENPLKVKASALHAIEILGTAIGGAFQYLDNGIQI